MKLEDADDGLREIAERAFHVAAWLSGSTVELHEGSGWYKCGNPILVWFYLVGPTGRKNPPNSILVTATQPDSTNRGRSVRLGNNMFGEGVPEMVLRRDDQGTFADYLEFVARVYRKRNEG